MTVITYPKWHSYIDKDGVKHTFQTQLYKTGIYGILDNNPKYQGTFCPKQLARQVGKLSKLQKDGNITDLHLGESITITDKSGLWEEVIIKTKK